MHYNIILGGSNLKLSYLDDDFTVYRNKKIVIFGTADKGRIVRNHLRSLGLEIVYFCDNDSKIWGCHIDGIEVLSPKRLKIINGEDFIIQIASKYSLEIEQQMQEQNITNYISYDEYMIRVSGLGKYQLFQDEDTRNFYLHKANIFQTLITQNDQPIWDYIAKNCLFKQDGFLILCLPPKTGDWTLNNSLKLANVDFANLWHTGFRYSTYMGEIFSKKKNKIITAVREPISQNLSIFFQMAEYLWDVFEYWEGGGDVQLLFDSWIEHELKKDAYMYSKNKIQAFPFFELFKYVEKIEYVIQNWFENCFNRFFHVDLLKHPFDQEKGYSIIREENKEIFIYQIEKLDHIKDELGDFVGAKDFRLINENVGQNKWYKRAYQAAKKEIILTEKYVNDCYQLDWVRHFYSDKDIRSFQQSWKRHCGIEGIIDE